MSATSPARAPRRIDHLVLAVPDLEAAARLYRAMGFVVGERNLHPWGTENAVVALEGAYLELIALSAGYRTPAPDDPAAPFAVMVESAVRRGGGLAAVAIRSDDADADAAVFQSAGLGTGQCLDFAREAEAPGGGRRVLRFGLAFAALPGLPQAGVFACRHHQPFGDPAGLRHPNGAIRLGAVLLAAEEPGRHAADLVSLLGRSADGPDPGRRFATSIGPIELVTPAEVAARTGAGATAGRFAAFEVAVAVVDDLRTCLARAGVPHDEVQGRTVVQPSALFGVALAFVSAPCDAER